MPLLSIDEAIRLLLLASPAVTALVNDRITCGKFRQPTSWPAIEIRTRKVSNDTAPVAEPRGDSGLATWRVGIISAMKTTEGREVSRSIARRVDEAVRLAVSGYRGIIGDGLSPVSDLEIQGIFSDGGDDAYMDDSQTHQFISVYDVWAEQQRPA